MGLAPRQWRDSVPAAKMPPKGKRGRPKKGEEKKQRKKKDPNAPKRPMSAYFLFMNATRPTVRKENPDASIGEVAKILGKMWGRGRRGGGGGRGQRIAKLSRVKRNQRAQLQIHPS